MSEFAPIMSRAELEYLDDADVVAGYRAGMSGAPEPGSAYSRSHWHGWRNGMVDTGRAVKDDAQAALARDVVRMWRAH